MSSVYLQILFHSAQNNPIDLEGTLGDVDHENFSITMVHLAKKGFPKSVVPIKAYRLSAISQFVLDYNYDAIEEVGDQEPLLVNADDIQAFPCGIAYSNQYIICFNTKTPELKNFNFKLRVVLYKKGTLPEVDDTPTPFCTCESFYTGLQFKNNSKGTITGVLLSDTKEVVGNITFDYLVVSPWLSYYKYFSSPICTNIIKNDRPLMIGHRGSGCSFCDRPSKYLENTLNSFVAAKESGADFIELDVQLTRDKAVVIFHDFLTETILDIDRAKNDRFSRLEIPVRDLSHHQLKQNKFKHASITKHSDQNIRDTLSDVSSEDTSIFPLLGEVMLSLPPNMGIDIEVKFPQQESDGRWELEGSYFDRNTVVERVLEETFENNRDIRRPIFFSSFDPGICVLLRQKQKHYPVMFLMSASSNEKYMDSRCQNIKTAVTFCLAERLHGVCPEIGPIIDVINKVSKIVHSQNLLLITWGTGNNNPESIEKQKASHVDGIIFDRMYDYIPNNISSASLT